jgi:hypothetical protein
MVRLVLGLDQIATCPWVQLGVVMAWQVLELYWLGLAVWTLTDQMELGVMPTGREPRAYWVHLAQVLAARWSRLVWTAAEAPIVRTGTLVAPRPCWVVQELHAGMSVRARMRRLINLQGWQSDRLGLMPHGWAL